MMCELHRLHSFSLYVGACLNVSGEQLEYIRYGTVAHKDVGLKTQAFDCSL